jgi:cell division inhibitor SulA
MPKYLIERELPGAANLSAADLRTIAQTSCKVLQELGPKINWQHSYVAGDKIYCVYIAPNEEMIREHARRGGFPANRITQVGTIMDLTTAEGK